MSWWITNLYEGALAQTAIDNAAILKHNDGKEEKAEKYYRYVEKTTRVMYTSRETEVRVKIPTVTPSNNNNNNSNRNEMGKNGGN